MAIKMLLQKANINHYSVTFLWLPSHIGIPGNDRADYLAAKTPNPHKTNLVFSVQDLKNYGKHMIDNIIQLEWDLDMNDNKLHEIKRDYFENNVVNLPRRDFVVLTRIRLGHTKLTHEHLLKGQNQPICETCNLPISVKHIIFECPKNALKRRQHGIVDNPEVALTYENNKAMLDYIKDIDIYKNI